MYQEAVEFSQQFWAKRKIITQLEVLFQRRPLLYTLIRVTMKFFMNRIYKTRERLAAIPPRKSPFLVRYLMASVDCWKFDESIWARQSWPSVSEHYFSAISPFSLSMAAAWQARYSWAMLGEHLSKAFLVFCWGTLSGPSIRFLISMNLIDSHAFHPSSSSYHCALILWEKMSDCEGGGVKSAMNGGVCLSTSSFVTQHCLSFSCIVSQGTHKKHFSTGWPIWSWRRFLLKSS